MSCPLLHLWFQSDGICFRDHVRYVRARLKTYERDEFIKQFCQRYGEEDALLVDWFFGVEDDVEKNVQGKPGDRRQHIRRMKDLCS